jgi:hypothetical protein
MVGAFPVLPSDSDREWRTKLSAKGLGITARYY